MEPQKCCCSLQKILLQTASCGHGHSHTKAPGSEEAAHIGRQEENITTPFTKLSLTTLLYQHHQQWSLLCFHTLLKEFVLPQSQGTEAGKHSQLKD